MGCSASSKLSNIVKPATSNHSNWRASLSKVEARELYEKDGSVPIGSSNELILFRTYLEAPLCLQSFAAYCKYKDKNLSNYLMCWVDILQFAFISDMDIEVQFDKAYLIYQKYMNGPSLGTIADAPEISDDPTINTKLDHLPVKTEFYYNTASILENSKNDGSSLPPNMFNEYGQKCLQYLYDHAFYTFITSPGYKASVLYLKERHNVIDVNDFDYLDKIGQGAFGCVIKCVKRTTGRTYAMKIQTKIGLLESYSDNPSRVCLERNALAKTNHPFIISMDYAFQTEQLVFIVMDLGTSGTLHDSLMNSKTMCLPQDRVCFYAAEMFLALVHIHNAGMIYRDLKPPNVLLNADGHIQLVDMGGTIDVTSTGNNSDDHIFADSIRDSGSFSNMIKRELSMSMSRSGVPMRGITSVNRFNEIADGKTRATSIMGTARYVCICVYMCVCIYVYVCL